MRLIDATPIERYMENQVKSLTGRNFGVLGWSTALAEIYNAPTVDAVAVRRCKDCKHWCESALPEDDRKGLCWAFGAQPVAVTAEDDYCSRAERKEDDDRE